MIARTLIIIGLIIVAIGLILHYWGNISFLGKLPGDLHFKKENFSFYFPITTCIIISLILTVVIYFFRRFL